LITDVFRLRLHRCTIITAHSPAKIAWRRHLTFKPLDEGHQSDIRDFATPAPDIASLIRATGADYPNNRPRLQAFSATADPRMKTICSSVRVEKNVRMLVL
jgi:hypothetical protein